MHHYIKNGKPFASEHPIYYFEWVYGAGTVKFGMHGTEAEYDLHCDCDNWPDRILVTKRPVAEVTGQQTFDFTFQS